MSYRAPLKDPLLIVSNCAVIQCVYYLSAASAMAAMNGLFCDVPFTLHQLFHPRAVGLSTPFGRVTVAAFLACSAGPGALLLMLVVGRARLCLDYAATLHFFHFVVSAAYGGFPATLSWWLTMLASLAVLSLAGEQLCMRREMREIPLRSRRRRDGDTELRETA